MIVRDRSAGKQLVIHWDVYSTAGEDPLTYTHLPTVHTLSSTPASFIPSTLLLCNDTLCQTFSRFDRLRLYIHKCLLVCNYCSLQLFDWHLIFLSCQQLRSQSAGDVSVQYVTSIIHTAVSTVR